MAAGRQRAGSALFSLGLMQDNLTICLYAMAVKPVMWTVLGIRDILVRIRICGSVSLTKMDSAPDLSPDPGPTLCRFSSVLPRINTGQFLILQWR
jgi:hypothetical protein